MRIANEDLLLTSGPVSLAADAELRPIYLGHVVNYSIQLTFTGSPSGTFKLQCSNDPGRPYLPGQVPQYDTVVHWTDIEGSDQIIAAAGNHTWDVQNAGYLWVKVVYTRSGGSGSITVARANTKGA